MKRLRCLVEGRVHQADWGPFKVWPPRSLPGRGRLNANEAMHRWVPSTTVLSLSLSLSVCPKTNQPPPSVLQVGTRSTRWTLTTPLWGLTTARRATPCHLRTLLFYTTTQTFLNDLYINILLTICFEKLLCSRISLSFVIILIKLLILFSFSFL